MSEGTSVAPPRPWNGITAKYAGRVLNDLERGGGCTLVAPMWPIIIGLIERNCLPGNELHPVIRALYAHFLAVVADEPGHTPDASYAAWLAGDITVDSTVRTEFVARWARSRDGAAPA